MDERTTRSGREDGIAATTTSCGVSSVVRGIKGKVAGQSRATSRATRRNGLIIDWERFKESVMNRFGPSKYEDPQGALSKLLQLGIVEDYQGEFGKLMNWVMDIPDSLFISYYISRLKLHLQRELLVSKPTTLGDVFSLIKARFDDQAAPVAGTVLNELKPVDLCLLLLPSRPVLKVKEQQLQPLHNAISSSIVHGVCQGASSL
ncbi:hypothetical protein Tco_0846041 [Tanacetum coccineum]